MRRVVVDHRTAFGGATRRTIVRLVSVLLAAAGPAAADLRVGFGNDVFTELEPPIDDSGFTHDFDIRFTRPYRDYVVGGAFLHRWITEAAGDRRKDLVHLVATAERAWPLATAVPLVGAAGARLGPVVTGNLGGRWMQNGWHTLTGTGPTLDDGLQHEYVGDLEAGALAGATGRVTLGTMVAAYAQLDAQGSVGTGVSSLEGDLGGVASVRLGDVVVGVSLEGAVMRFHVADDALAMPGAYGEGWQLAWRAGAHVAWRRIRVEYQYRANEGGSGEPFGLVAFTVKQAGTTF